MPLPTPLSSALSPFGRRLSCGVVLLTDAGELLLCHVTGRDHWDLPKGGAHDDETPLQAALRETREETGLVLPAEALLDLGRLPFSHRKDLHLFAARCGRLDTEQLWCESRFDDAYSGQALPEMDGYGWFAFRDVPVQCSRKLCVLLRERLDLPAVLAALQEKPLVTPAVLPAPAAAPAPSTWLPPPPVLRA
jgi:8-oxo-dGTP pyrophosphatase MutT (NUDIX family)